MESNNANHSSSEDLYDKDHDEESSARSKDRTIADEEHSVDSIGETLEDYNEEGTIMSPSKRTLMKTKTPPEKRRKRRILRPKLFHWIVARGNSFFCCMRCCAFMHGTRLESDLPAPFIDDQTTNAGWKHLTNVQTSICHLVYWIVTYCP
jgi:hypothetical protein